VKDPFEGENVFKKYIYDHTKNLEIQDAFEQVKDPPPPHRDSRAI
jgi:hypothetical protein